MTIASTGNQLGCPFFQVWVSSIESGRKLDRNLSR